MTEQEQREAVVKAARSFVGTRYHHEGKIKGVGVDCATLIALSFEEAGARPPIDVAPYSYQWHVHHEEPLYEKAIVRHGGRLVDVPQIGDIALYFQGKQFAHGAIVTNVLPLVIIHAYAPSRCVVEGPEAEFALINGQDKKFYSAW